MKGGDKLIKDFDCAISFLSEKLYFMLKKLPDKIKNEINEICIRTNKPLVLIANGKTMFLEKSGHITYIFSENLCYITPEEMQFCFNRLCEFSVYSYSESITQGFITLKGGHRVGISGTAVIKNSDVTSIRDVNSLNIRIAGEFKGCADNIIKSVFSDGLKNVIIAGPPSSGKTTLLRDIARQISSARLGEYYKVAVVDERFEISPVDGGVCCCDTGPNTDVLSGFRKADGIMMALRTLSPKIIICDEIGTIEECKAIQNGLNSGVNFILSIHASAITELINKPQFNQLKKSGINAVVVLLSDEPCEIKQIFKAGDLNDENYSVSDYCLGYYTDRSVS